ncbi:MAG: type 1 glutamine amidotransferase [Pirellulaceae bacterium]|jgi:GMP synthase (glutamine-hydrolysing)|nr:aminotransferase [Planctomycetaceae bacterium]MDP6466730.1 type 1 glutamine amidotransferase [Pirellulaceae bacterium]
MPNKKLRYLLLQMRDGDDPMRDQEVACFARCLRCDADQIRVFDLISGAPSIHELNSVDAVLLGGSGAYSVAEGGPWLAAGLEAMGELYSLGKPTFASCWGFQAMARAMGGVVVTDLARAEVGSVEIMLTAAGKEDPLFGGLPSRFLAQMGHQDIVVDLPADATLLASSQRVANQAFRFQGKPIYCTQFHPELNREALLQRVVAYPEYPKRILGVGFDEFANRHCIETPETDSLLSRFIAHMFA